MCRRDFDKRSGAENTDAAPENIIRASGCLRGGGCQDCRNLPPCA
jgi:hypothetical protein